MLCILTSPLTLGFDDVEEIFCNAFVEIMLRKICCNDFVLGDFLKLRKGLMTKREGVKMLSNFFRGQKFWLFELDFAV